MLTDPRLNPLSGSLIDPQTGSHPAVRFDTHPAVRGELYNLDLKSYRDDVVENVVRRTIADFKSQDPRLLLEETLYNERLRLKKSRANFLTSPYIAGRNSRDARFIGKIESGLKSTIGLEDYQNLLKEYGGHFATEICGNFEPKM